MNKKVILHIPHSSTNIPFQDGYTVNENQLKEEQLLLTDWYTDDLFEHKDAIKIIAGFSRLFCDVERFSDDSAELLSTVGMGVLYEKRDDGTILREVTPELRTKIIDNFYIPHHQRLTEEGEDQLKKFGKVLIIDCHSFPNVPCKRDLIQDDDRPDYNIGTDPFHTSKELIEAAIQFFNKRNLTIGINTPYAGSIVPMKYSNKNDNVQSIMLEINRRLYLEQCTNKKSSNYAKVKETVNDFVDFLSEVCL